MISGSTRTFRIRVAGITIEIECFYNTIISLCKDYIVHSPKPDFLVKASQEEIIALRREVPKSEREFPGVAFRYADEALEPIVLHRKIVEKLISFNTLLLHGATISTKNQAYIFTAPSGVGKSTRARIWLDIYPDSFVVNGDKPFIKITEKEILACGTPWSGNEGWNTNTMVPLRAIFLLERADEGENSSIEEVSIGKAFPFLLQQIYYPSDSDLMRKTIQLLKALEGKVKFYKFRSTLTKEAIRLAYEIARPK